MVFILVLMTFAAFVIYDIIKHHRLAEATSPKAVEAYPAIDRIYPPVIREKGLVVKKGLYYHPEHTWAKLVSRKKVEVGLDDFAQRFVGTIQEIVLPRVGAQVKQGEPIFQIKKGNRVLKLVAPVSGKIVEVNPRIEMDPEVINDSPYEEGWLVRIQPTSLKDNLRNLLDDFMAQKWIQTVKQAFMSKYAQDYAFAMQDGGELYPGFGMSLKDEHWHEVVEEFFRSE